MTKLFFHNQNLFLGLKLVWDQIFFRPIILWTQFFWTQNFFRPKIFFRPNIFIHLIFVLDSKYFWSKSFLKQSLFGHKTFLANKFLKLRIFWTRNAIWTQIFFNPKLSGQKKERGTRIQLNLNLECGSPSSACHLYLLHITRAK